MTDTTVAPMTNREWVNDLLDQAERAPDSLLRSMLVATALEVQAGKHDESRSRPTRTLSLA